MLYSFVLLNQQQLDEKDKRKDETVWSDKQVSKQYLLDVQK